VRFYASVKQQNTHFATMFYLIVSENDNIMLF